MKEVWFYKTNESNKEHGPFDSRQLAEAAWQERINDPTSYMHLRWWQREYGPPRAEFIEKPGTAEAIVSLIQTLSKEEQQRVMKGMGWSEYGYYGAEGNYPGGLG